MVSPGRACSQATSLRKRSAAVTVEKRALLSGKPGCAAIAREIGACVSVEATGDEEVADLLPAASSSAPAPPADFNFIKGTLGLLSSRPTLRPTRSGHAGRSNRQCINCTMTASGNKGSKRPWRRFRASRSCASLATIPSARGDAILDGADPTQPMDEPKSACKQYNDDNEGGNFTSR